MASNQIATLVAFAAILLPAFAMATEFVVGDSTGWTTNFDYQDWAKDKVFRVGDKLVFKYPVGKHNVLKVDGTAFKDCAVPANANDTLTSGNDQIELATPGNKWYICGVPKHCDAGQKLSITVVEDGYKNSASVRGIISTGYKVFVAAIVVVVAFSL